MKCLQLLVHLPFNFLAMHLHVRVIGNELLLDAQPDFVLLVLILLDVVLLYLEEDLGSEHLLDRGVVDELLKRHRFLLRLLQVIIKYLEDALIQSAIG